MANTSATGGYLQETTTLDRVTLEKVWHDFFVGITGFDTNLVRPAEQIDPPPTPGASVNWLAYKIVNTPSQDYPVVYHNGAAAENEGASFVIDQTPENVLVYVYGPKSDDIANSIRRSTYVAQNRTVLRLFGIAVQQVSGLVQVPTLRNEKWYRRMDLTIHTVREAVGRFEIRNLLGAAGLITTDIKHGMEIDLHRFFIVEE